jgi:hypothetical protein
MEVILTNIYATIPHREVRVWCQVVERFCVNMDSLYGKMGELQIYLAPKHRSLPKEAHIRGNGISRSKVDHIPVDGQDASNIWSTALSGSYHRMIPTCPISHVSSMRNNRSPQTSVSIPIGSVRDTR